MQNLVSCKEIPGLLLFLHCLQHFKVFSFFLVELLIWKLASCYRCRCVIWIVLFSKCAHPWSFPTYCCTHLNTEWNFSLSNAEWHWILIAPLPSSSIWLVSLYTYYLEEVRIGVLFANVGTLCVYNSWKISELLDSVDQITEMMQMVKFINFITDWEADILFIENIEDQFSLANQRLHTNHFHF